MDETLIRRLDRVRKYKQRHNPHFITTNSWRYVRVDPRWRRPRGIDNKMAEHHPGWPKTVKIGYRVPRLLRGKHVAGNVVREEFIVHNMADLELALPDRHVVRLARTVGRKKKELLLQQANSWGLVVLNPLQVAEGVGTEEAEELSLDRDLGELDLDIKDLEKTTTPKEKSASDAEDAGQSPSAAPVEEEGDDLLADEFKDESSKPKKKKK